MDKIKNVVVLGSGVLGGQVAWQSAFKGMNVTVYDIKDEPLERCKANHKTYANIYQKEMSATESDIKNTVARIKFTTDLAEACKNADLVIEAVPEIPAIKTDVYQKLSTLLPEHAVISTNSSTFLPSQFAADTGREDRFCAMHFANLIWKFNLVEIMGNSKTSDETLTKVTEFAINIGMLPIPVGKEQNGYVLNSWLVPLYKSSVSLLSEGVCTPENLDRTYLIANRGCSLGPCGIMDVVGMKTLYDIFMYWGKEDNDQEMLKNAAWLKENYMDKNKMGMLTGEGFYQYPNPAFESADFLDVPDLSAVPEIVKLARLEPLPA